MPMRKRTRKMLRVRQTEARSNGNGLSPSANPAAQRLQPFTPRETAAVLGVHLQTLASWRYRGRYPELQPFRTKFGRWRYPVEAVEAFLRDSPPEK
jgi:hypothetical protein